MEGIYTYDQLKEIEPGETVYTVSKINNDHYILKRHIVKKIVLEEASVLKYVALKDDKNNLIYESGNMMQNHGMFLFIDEEETLKYLKENF